MGIQILLVDDHEIVLDGLRTLLKSQRDMEVVGEASDGAQAVEATFRLRPDVVVMDLTMPGLNGIEATRQILQRQPQVKVLCLSMHSDPRFQSAVMAAGASGYLVKDCALEELVTAINTVARNEIYRS